MVEIRHCDRCGNRLPLDHDPAEACPKCKHVPAQPEAPSAPAQHPRASARETPAARADRAAAAARPGRPRAASSAAVFALAAGAGTLVAVAAGLLLSGGGRTPPPGPTPPPAPAVSPEPGPEPAPSPGPVSEPVAAPVSRPAPEPVPEPAPAEPDKGGDDDFFAKLRADSEERRKKLAEDLAKGIAEADVRMTTEADRWSPGWVVRNSCGPDTGQGLLGEHLGRTGVLKTHPLSAEAPARLEREVDLPAGRAVLLVTVTTHNSTGDEDWVLRVFADDERVGEEVVGRPRGVAEWQTFRFDLGARAGRRVRLRLENASGGPKHPWNTEHGFWGEVRIGTE